MIGSVAGLLVAILFLAFAVQVMLGLYATSTLRATLHDAAARAANSRAGPGPVSVVELAALARQAEASLGAMGERTTVMLELVDDDGDGIDDVVVGHAVAMPPRVVPPSIGGMVGFEQIRVGVRVRLEQFRN